MAMILLVFVGVLCLYVGVRILGSEERNRVFNKRPIEVTDVKGYNRSCGILVLGFGVVAEITLYFMTSITTWVSSVLTLLLIAEAFGVVALYNRIERKYLKRR